MADAEPFTRFDLFGAPCKASPIRLRAADHALAPGLNTQEHRQQITTRLALIPENPSLHSDHQRQCATQRPQARCRHLHAFRPGIGPHVGSRHHAFILQCFQHVGNLHRMNVTELRQARLHHGFAGPTEPRDQHQRHELEVGQIEPAQCLVDLAQVAMKNAPQDETDGLLRCPQRDRGKQILDRSVVGHQIGGGSVGRGAVGLSSRDHPGVDITKFLYGVNKYIYYLVHRELLIRCISVTNPTLKIAFWNYDRTRLLADGTVKIPGVNAEFHSARIVPEIFEAMVRRRAYDVSELGMTYFLRTFEDAVSPFLAIPVFPVRSFRHGAIYINKASGIASPKELAGKRIGELALYGHDAGVMPKGILSDDYGVKPEQSRWIIGGLDFPMDPVDFVAHPVPAGVDVEWAGEQVDLGEMLEAGEIDALISADAPRCVLAKSSRVGRLFEDYEKVEKAYFGRTGIFPIMHCVVVRRELAVEHPDLIKAVYQGFCRAKDQMAEQYVKGMTFNNMTMMLPWLSKLIGGQSRPAGIRLVAVRCPSQPRGPRCNPSLSS